MANHFLIPVAVGLGGFVGALARFYISAAVLRAAGDRFGFVATLAVNLIGCLAIGVLWSLSLRTNWLSPVMQRCLITGLLGSLTTFSTFALDSLNLLQAGRFGAATANAAVNLFVGLLLVWLGMLLAETLVAPSSVTP